ncbi:MAG: hypothetical protein M1608_08680 [Candidatus Omnitrophica bacterium]|nr:hypothetical protein [Candidatus Omnitrophota bacterium]
MPSFKSWASVESPNARYVGCVLWAIGGIYFPMAFLGVSIYGSLAALNPLLVIGSIFKAPIPYFSACLLGALALGLGSLASGIAQSLDVRLLSVILSNFTAIYSLIVLARVLGHFYFRNQGRLNWK